jgi:hypothetical protein
MLFDGDLAAMLARRLGGRWRRRPDLAGLGHHLRRDLGLPPLQHPALTLLRRHGH